MAYTAIIPSAGNGGRLSPMPGVVPICKVLARVGGRTIFDRQLELLKPMCDQFIYVTSPLFANAVSARMHEHPHEFNPSSTVLIQEKPIGTADAVRLALPFIQNEDVIVMWGDVVPVDVLAIRNALTPTVLGVPHCLVTDDFRENSALHYITDRDCVIDWVIMKDEGRPLPSMVVRDHGIYYFRSDMLIPALYRYCELPLHETGRELHFPPFLAYIRSVKLRWLPVTAAVGINTPDDVSKAEELLSK
jgi:NDP-sugar pyrophosphorylase family protein